MLAHSVKVPTASTSSNCFVYGTLMSSEVLRTLIGRVPQMECPAFLPPSFSRHPVRGQVYPGVISTLDCSQVPSKSWDEIQATCVKGILLTDLSSTEMKVFDWFEDVDVDYYRSILPVFLNSSEGVETLDANVYVWARTETLLDLELDWSYDKFRRQKLEWYLQSTVGPCREEIDRLGLESI